MLLDRLTAKIKTITKQVHFSQNWMKWCATCQAVLILFGAESVNGEDHKEFIWKLADGA